VDVFVELRAVITDFQAKLATARGEMDVTEKKGGSSFASLGKGVGLGLAAAGVATAAVGAASVKMAADFQTNMSKLVTSGGELQKNLGGDMRGVEQLMGQTGTSSQQLATGLYVINSAGFHAGAGLTVLKAAAEGAKTENADLGTVTDGLTTLMNDYHISAAGAAEVTSKMVMATSLGKTTFQDLAGSLHTVAPAADVAGISMNQVLGAMASMTAKGTPAADAATYLRQTILQLSNPSAKAALEMSNLGLSSIDVSKNLGARGLTGTLDLLTSAIASKMGPAGTVLIDKMKAAAGSTTGFQKVLANLPPAQQTYIGALATMVGGTKSMQAALELTGASAATFQADVKKVAGATTEAGGHVAGWSIVQQNFNQKIAEAKGTVEALGIQLGMVLIPVIERVVSSIMSAVTWMEKHRQITEILAIGLGVLTAAMIGLSVAMMIVEAQPITLIIIGVIAAITLLTIGIYELVKNWKQVWSDIKRWTEDGVNWVKAHFKLMLEAVLVVVTGGFALIPVLIYRYWGQITDYTSKLWHDVTGFFSNIWRDVTTWVTRLWTDTVNLFVRLRTDIGTWVGHIRDDAVAFWQLIYNNTIGKMFQLVNDVANFFEGLGAQIATAIQGIPGDMLKFGSFIISQLMAGVESMVGALGSYLEGLGKKIVNFFKNPLGIFSPSTVFFDMGKQLMVGLQNGIAAHAAGPLAAAAAAANAIGTTAGAVTIGTNQALGQQMAAAYGWTGAEWNALNQLEMMEAGWNNRARNPSSGAYGIPQALPESKLPFAGTAAGGSDAGAQIGWMLNYIKGRYGDPIAALAHENMVHWYDQGGILPPGLTMAMNATGANEYISRSPGAGGVTVQVIVQGNVYNWDQQAQALVEPVRKALLQGAGRNGTRIF
jgi:TP901 family phage tail tape measure protein